MHCGLFSPLSVDESDTDFIDATICNFTAQL